jgi:hypothetical protein
MKSLSGKKKGSLILGVLILISLFLPWFDCLFFSKSLIALPALTSNILSWIGESPSFSQQLAIYIGYAFFVLGAAGLYFNYKGDIQKSRISYYLMIAYLLLVVILNISDIPESGSDSDGPSIFDVLEMGAYIFIVSFILNLIFLSEEKKSASHDDEDVIIDPKVGDEI